MTKSMLDIGREILAAQPFSSSLGVILERMETGLCEVRLLLNESHLQHHGVVHGGVTASLADICLAFAGGTIFPDAVTADLRLDYVRPGNGEKLIGVGTVIHQRGRSAYCEAKIYSNEIAENNIIILATGTIRQVSK